MKHTKLKSAMLSLFLLAGAAASHAQTVTVGPTGQYPTPCAAFPNLVDGETVKVDANGGVPYAGQADCAIRNNNLTIVGVNGRPVISGAGTYTSKGLWNVDGHDIVIDNFDFGNASGQQNAAGLRIEDAAINPGTGNGGNITVQHSYVHDNGTGILIGNSDAYNGWYSANPYITFSYDEFVHNGNHDGQGNTHNMYQGFDNNGTLVFTLQYSWSHDSYVGHTVKDRAPNSNILYNLVGDEEGNTSYVMQFPLGGSTYVVGNILYKVYTSGGNSNQGMFLFADSSDNTSSDPEYAPPHQDLHFVNNTMVDDPANNIQTAFVNISCFNSDNSQCAVPGNGPAVTTKAVVENNIFVGDATMATNQLNAYVTHNIIEANTPANLAAMFVDTAHFDYHLVAGAPAIGAGIYPPTDNTGASDPKALAKYEFVVPTGILNRPTPSGSTMDAGAYSYPRVGTKPTLSLSYTSNVTAPGTGTITVSGLPTPPAGSYNYASFISSNQAAVPNPPAADSTTGTVTTTFTVNPAVTQPTAVTIDVYAGNGHAVASVTVNPGPPVLSSLTLDYKYAPFSSVHLEGPAPAGGTVINLSSSNPTYLYTPSTVTVPQGQITAETGTQTGSLWGQNPQVSTQTLTATQGSVTKSLSIDVFTPGYHSTEPEYTSIPGGQPLPWCIVMVGFFPPGGGNVQVTSDNPSVIPNQTLTSGYGGCNANFQNPTNFTTGVNFNGDVAIATNNVSVSTTVNVTLNLNGAITSSAITVNPGPTQPGAPTNLTATAGSSRPVNLSWTASPTSGVTYDVYRSTTSGFTKSSSNQIASGLTGTTYADYSVLPSTTYYYLVDASNSGVLSTPSNQASAATKADAASGTDVLAINVGGGAASPYVADVDFTGGSTYSVSNAIDTSLVANPAPQAVYQTQRNVPGSPNMSYTIPGLTAGGSYVVRLHFAEIYYNSAQAREFNVVINGTQVLTNFDMYAAAGAQFKAVALNFATTANTSGQIVINFNNGAVDNAAVNGIEIQQVSSGGGGDVVAINSAGSAVGNYAADEFVTGGGIPSSFSANVNTAGVVNPAPQAVYNSQLYAGNGNITYTIPGLTANGYYTVRLHFAELYFTGAGSRQFDVVINGTKVLTNFDILAAAGGQNIAIAKDFSAKANSSGQIVINFNNDAANYAAINGIEIQKATDVIAINSSGAAASPYIADKYYSGGTTSTTTATVSTTGVVNPAPQAVYKSERYISGSQGPFTYTIPNLTVGGTYSVRLHFNENYYTAPGQRQFNVSINGTQVLTNYDVYAVTGGQNRANVQVFTAVANSSGQIVIQFSKGAVDSPEIAGIEIQH